MAVAVTIQREDVSGRIQRIYGTLVFSGSYPGTPGETINLRGAGRTGIPRIVTIRGEAGYMYEYAEGANASDGEVAVKHFDYDAGADGPAIHIPTAGYPAAVTGDTVRFVAEFDKLLG